MADLRSPIGADPKDQLYPTVFSPAYAGAVAIGSAAVRSIAVAPHETTAVLSMAGQGLPSSPALRPVVTSTEYLGARGYATTLKPPTPA